LNATPKSLSPELNDKFLRISTASLGLYYSPTIVVSWSCFNIAIVEKSFKEGSDTNDAN
jgi:hypothetical protein